MLFALNWTGVLTRPAEKQCHYEDVDLVTEKKSVDMITEDGKPMIAEQRKRVCD
jgi:hypothetical protein